MPSKKATLELRIPNSVADKLKEIAKLAGVSFDQVVNVALATYLIQTGKKDHGD